ncbi:MAG: exo-beta-N-acetylmuramidase NamZ domain-containing protein [Planctomycetaceae bacterium]
MANRRVGLITNHTGLANDGVSTVQLLNESEAVNLVSLFSPEHGFAGKLDEANIGDARDHGTGLKIHSLYGKTRKPTAEMLSGIDTLVFDIQDIGTRFYTYISTMKNAMEAAAAAKLRFVVLDRPNPINGVTVSGPVLDAGSESFVAAHSLPVRHGMTVGEIAGMLKVELHLDLDLQVVRVEGWQRDDMFDATGQVWTNPSPNMRCLNQALIYPGVGLLETTNISVGRGTDTPFEVIGAPWIEAVPFAKALNRLQLPGVRFVPLRFTPESSKYEGQQCGGVNIVITNRRAFEPIGTGLAIGQLLLRLYPNDWDTKSLNRLLGCRKVCDGLLAGQTPNELAKLWEAELRNFMARRASFLLYPESAGHQK